MVTQSYHTNEQPKLSPAPMVRPHRPTARARQAFTAKRFRSRAHGPLMMVQPHGKHPTTASSAPQIRTARAQRTASRPRRFHVQIMFQATGTIIQGLSVRHAAPALTIARATPVGSSRTQAVVSKLSNQIPTPVTASRARPGPFASAVRFGYARRGGRNLFPIIHPCLTRTRAKSCCGRKAGRAATASRTVCASQGIFVIMQKQHSRNNGHGDITARLHKANPCWTCLVKSALHIIIVQEMVRILTISGLSVDCNYATTNNR
jgi:ribosomal protein L35